jgi:hypothetical protein
MKRLVYSPQVNAWVKTDTGIFDLSPYITSYSVTRKVNAVSSAELTFRNPKVECSDGNSRFLFTQYQTMESDGSTSYRPMFHPMDPIVITLTRLKGHPVQVFTGYCDKTPYIQLFPGTANLTASCTLKRLMYTYWDPGLTFVIEYLSKLGWGGEQGKINIGAEKKHSTDLNDSSIGYLLYRILVDVGNWDDADIFIQELPNKQIQASVKAIYQDLTKDAKASFQTFSDFLDQIIGYGNLGGGGGATTVSQTSSSGGSNLAPATENVVTNNMSATALPWSETGNGSTYGSSHKYNYTDPGDNSYGNQPPASGLDPDVPGVATRRTIGTGNNLNWYVVRSPSGRAAALPQVDWGPAESTGRIVDVNTPASVGVFGYSQASDHSVNFPTDQGSWSLYFCGQGSTGKTKAERIVRDGKL